MINRIEAYNVHRTELIKRGELDTPERVQLDASQQIEILQTHVSRGEEVSEAALLAVGARLRSPINHLRSNDQGNFRVVSNRILQAYLRPMVFSPLLSQVPITSARARYLRDTLGLGEARTMGLSLADELQNSYADNKHRINEYKAGTDPYQKVTEQLQGSDLEAFEALLSDQWDLKGALNELTPLLLFGRHVTAKCVALPVTYYDDSIRKKLWRIDGKLYFGGKPSTQNVGYQVKSNNDTSGYAAPVLTQFDLGNSRYSPKWRGIDKLSYASLRTLVLEGSGKLPVGSSSVLDSLKTDIEKTLTRPGAQVSPAIFHRKVAS